MTARKLRLIVDSRIHSAGEREKLAHLHSLIVKELSAMDMADRVVITLECEPPGEPGMMTGAERSEAARAVPDGPFGRLSERQRQIAYMLCNHYSIRRIASELYVSENTVKKHMQNMKKALELEHSGAEFIYYLK
ncbi:response regulator transcription factor [Paenibacillus chartarius]|uniref:Response regulator transcription factor n=1 Tax=Paenibacillus chartarius TaxID=747481 RepID=A0ABV6DT42_9BACL